MSGAVRSGVSTDTFALSVHGPVGVLDLVVPAGAEAGDVAREYATQAGLGAVPSLYTRLGEPLPNDVPLARAGIGTGDVLVASLGFAAPAGPAPVATAVEVEPPGAVSVLWFSLASAVALVAGWFAANTESFGYQTAAIDLLAVAAVIGVLPVGRYAAHRAVAAPAFAAAAAFASAYEPGAERLPMMVGVAALAAAVTAAVAQALSSRRDEALSVWMVTGGLLFALTGAAALAGFDPQVVWAVLLLLAMLAARFVPAYAVDVPDQVLIDLERLAVTAWSARDRPVGRRGRMVIPRSSVALLVARGQRIVTAGCVAIAAAVALSAPLLLETADFDLDRGGARALVFLVGGGLLFAGRSYRHTGPRLLLRSAGLLCWAVLAAHILVALSPAGTGWLTLAALLLAAVLMLVAIATGRGWRSVWWARKAEVAEAICGSFAVGSLCLAVGLFRHLWELTS